ncbi:hypothetical protein LLEC1_05627 [Akanthomyces lecanii]|uniref:RNA polymerase I, subunit RPA34.5 n=1 Tax=Cordyceps confragosa TaxID=2714763 RepID=A0A179I3U0_CORDF|nr:hypothetical protein LLEC1_05627 [Akanthomyces lecanii]
MAPKEPFKVHSLNKHIEETTKGLKANASSKKTSAKPSIKKTAATPATSLFPNNNSESDSSSSSSDDSDSDGPAFLKVLGKPKASKRRSKDDEIADSDVERTSAAKRSKPAKKTAMPAKTKTKAASSSDDTSSEAGSESSDEEVSSKGAAVTSKASTSAGSPTTSSGSDSDSGSGSSSEDSSSDDDAESESESEAAPAKPVATVKESASKPVRAKEPESDSDDSSPEGSESASEEPSLPAAKPTSKPASNGTKTAAKAANVAKSDDEGDDSRETKSSDEAQSGTESSGTESSSDEEADEADESMHIAERAQTGQVALPQLLPPDFELRKSDRQSNGQDVARICSEANLEGKQLWYFTLPANVPVSVVENLEFPMDASQRGGRILSHNGEDYGISFDSTPPVKSIQILIPSADGSTYQPSRHSVDEVMQIRRITQIGATTATPASVGSTTKVARPQPKGLKARFQPLGVSSDMGTLGLDSDAEDDVEMQDVPASGSTPKASQNTGKNAKAAVDPKQSASKSKKSKRKHSASEDEDAAAAEQLMEESVSAVTKSKKQKTASRGSPDLGSEPALPPLRQTFVAPPPVPGSSATADVESTPAKKSKKAKISKTATEPATPVFSSQVSGSSKKETPVPVPAVPHLLKSASSAGTPTEKKTKKNKEKAVSTGNPA